MPSHTSTPPLLRRHSHPLAGSRSASAKPPAQAEVQPPLVQAATLLAGAAQATPQPPQLAVSPPTWPATSSILPLQSLSRPSQVSGCGLRGVPLHTTLARL